jgi:hypothetical protein
VAQLSTHKFGGRALDSFKAKINSMSWPVENLKPSIARRLELFRRQVVTESELSSFIFSESAFTLLDNPAGWPEVADALETVPLPILSSVAVQVAAKQLPGGEWEWPPIGAIGHPAALTTFTRASAAEADVMEELNNWLIERVRTD